MRAETGNRKGAKDITLVIAVKDTGIGIHQEDIERLFEKFQRMDLEKTGTVEGTGLGLAITQKLLSMMKGDIHVESAYGKGSEFTVRIPQRIAGTEPVGEFRMSFVNDFTASQPYSAAFRAPKAQILIVDDTRMNLTVAIGLLSKTRMKIDTATGGAEALEMTRSTAYDLILMDQRMPGMDGLETMRGIRTQENGLNRGTPVICMTADAVQGARERYLAEGFTDYISKCRGMVVRYVLATWPATRSHTAGSVTVYREFENGKKQVRKLCYHPISGYCIDPRDSDKWCSAIMECNAISNGYNVYGHALTDKEIETIVDVHPNFKWTLKKAGSCSCAKALKLLQQWIKDPNIELLVGAHYDSLAMNKSFVRYSKEKRYGNRFA